MSDHPTECLPTISTVLSKRNHIKPLHPNNPSVIHPNPVIAAPSAINPSSHYGEHYKKNNPQTNKQPLRKQ